MSFDVHCGDCLDVMAEMEENSVDTIITDPPYGLEFMGKDWDKGVPGPRFWREALRVAKPGAMMLAFGGTRTWHRLACAIEDAGWELKDTMMYLFGSGFPKSRRLDLDASRCLPADAFCQCDANKHSISRTYPVRSVLDRIRKAGLSDATEHGALPSVLCDLDISEDSLRDYQPCHHSDGGPLRQAAENVLTFALLLEYAQEHNRSDVLLDDRVAESLHSLYQVLCIDLPSMRDYLLPSYSESVSQLLRACEDGQSREGDLSNYVSRLAGSLDVQAWMDADISASRRPHIHSLVFCLPLSFSRMLCSPKADTIIPQSEWCANCGGIHNRWTGYGSSLKPAFEPILVAMKPRDGTYAENAERWGVAGLWIDGGRVPTDWQADRGESWLRSGKQATPDGDWQGPSLKRDGSTVADRVSSLGRWPANLLLDEEAAAMLDEQSGELKSGDLLPGHKRPFNFFKDGTDGVIRKAYGGDSGGASRFFYCAKASRAERNAGLEGMEERAAQSTGWSGDGMPLLQDGTERKMPHKQNHHPTVKPLALLRYLCRLTKTPTGGVVLDPFMGSGSTGCAAVQEGRDFIGIELDAEYCEIARRRIEHWARQPVLEMV